MHYLYVDFETYYDRDLTLKKSTLRNYLSRTHPLGASLAEDDGEIFWFATEPGSHVFPPSLLQHLRDRSLDPDWTVVAHNAAFDVRVWRYCLGLPQPRHVHCTLELACAAYPGQPGGYSLGNLATTLNLGGAKIEINLLPGKYSEKELYAYCKQDTLLCRNLHRKCVSRLHPDEVAIAELCNDIRSKHLLIDTGTVIDSVRQMSSDAAVSAAAAVGALGDDVGFGWENDGAIRSVKPQAMKRLLLDNLGFDTQSISRKKIDPEKLRANPAAAEALRLVEATNKTLSHKRRIGVFINAPEVDMELGYFRAMTGRFSSPQVGGAKGINGHNLPKRQKALAKIVRSLFRLPRDKCWVRADLANVEYRIEAWLFGASAPNAIFANDVLADPYASFWFMATGQRCSKTVNVAARQLAKAAVLGLGFLMGLARWCEELMRGIADGMLGVTLADMESLCQANGWGPPTSRYVKAIQTKLRAPWQIIAVANNTRELFHKIHPEFRLRTMWIDQTVAGLLRTQDADRYLDEAYALPAAPDRTRLGLSWAPDCFGPGTKSVQLTCGVWPTPTVTWRDLRMLETKHGGYCLHCMHASKGMRPLTPNLMSENPTQSAARNALCKGQLELRRMGYQYQYSVHDEVLLMVDRNPAAIHAARDALLRVFGPGNTLGYGWAVVIDPSEITVTESLHEEPMRDWNNMDLEHLP